MRLRAHLKTLVLLVVAVAGIASRAQADIVTVPAGAVPGNKYRLVFVTGTSRDATSSNIDDYNAFVSAYAASIPELSALGVTWKAIASTSTVFAIDNIGSSADDVGIFRLDGALVDHGTAGLFWGDLVSAVRITGDGSALDTPVWTGTLADGTSYPSVWLGSGSAVLGMSYSTTASWLNWSEGYPVIRPSDGLPFAFSLYGISSEITVGGPAAVPEPASIGLTTLAAAVVLFARRRKLRSRGPLGR
jgi:hypothetical protein